jgi:hypothetical protein
MPDYRQADLDEAHRLVSGLSSKEYEAALAARERKGAEKLERERELRLFYGLDEFEEVYGG